MNTFKIILLVVAYTMGIISISLQIICYRKEIEYKETIAFMFSFLLLIISITILEFNILTGSFSTEIFQDAFFFFCLLLAITTPLNVHRERIVKNKGVKNKIILWLSLMLCLFMISGLLFGFKEIAQQIVIIYLYSSIIYSLLMVAQTKPELLVLRREKTEKKMSRLVLVFFLLYVSAEIVNKYLQFMPDETLFDGSIIISFVFIIIALEKIIDDFKRLNLFVNDRRFSAEMLAYYNISPRESEVMTLLIKGTSYKEIAVKLFISLPTVKTHVSNIYQKMNINNKIELINLVSEKDI